MKRNSFTRLNKIFLTLVIGLVAGSASLPVLLPACRADEPQDEISSDARLSEHERATIQDMISQSQAAPDRAPAIVYTNGKDGEDGDSLPPPPDSAESNGTSGSAD